MIWTPLCSSRQAGSTDMLFDLERSIGKFDPRSPEVKVTKRPK